MSQRTLIAVLAALSLFFAVRPVEAHPRLKASFPAADASTASPREIRLIFGEGLIAKLSGLALKDQTGKSIETGQAAADAADKKQLVVPLKAPLAAGQYTVEWYVPALLYGQLLIAKLVFFALMLFLAAMNRFWLVPAVMAGNSRQQRAKTLSRLRYHVMSEQLLGLVIIALVSVLGTLAPGGDG